MGILMFALYPESRSPRQGLSFSFLDMAGTEAQKKLPTLNPKQPQPKTKSESFPLYLCAGNHKRRDPVN